MSSSDNLFVLLRIASTLATRIFGLNGFDTYSSTPSSKPNNSSASSLFAVSIMIGTFDCFLISLHVSHPSIFGIMTSRIISDISFLEKNISMASSPLAASKTLYPFLCKKSLTSILILLSSSTTRIFKSAIIFSFYNSNNHVQLSLRANLTVLNSYFVLIKYRGFYRVLRTKILKLPAKH